MGKKDLYPLFISNLGIGGGSLHTMKHIFVILGYCVITFGFQGKHFAKLWRHSSSGSIQVNMRVDDGHSRDVEPRSDRVRATETVKWLSASVFGSFFSFSPAARATISEFSEWDRKFGTPFFFSRLLFKTTWHSNLMLIVLTWYLILSFRLNIQRYTVSATDGETSSSTPDLRS